MIPATFDYHKATSVDEALKLLSDLDDAKLLAGGHSLIPTMRLRLAEPANLIDISGIDTLRGISKNDTGDVIIGATATHYEIESSELVQSIAPLLAAAAASIGDVQVRNRGTIGGSLTHADPNADYPAAILASDAQITIQGQGGTREVAASDFFQGLFETAVGEDELITQVRIAAPAAGTGSAYLKLKHPASGFAVVGAAASVTVSNGQCTSAKLAFTGLTTHAFRASNVEAALTGNAIDEAAITSAAQQAGEGIDFTEDSFASAAYRASLAKTYAKRALLAALADSG